MHSLTYPTRTRIAPARFRLSFLFCCESISAEERNNVIKNDLTLKGVNTMYFKLFLCLLVLLFAPLSVDAFDTENIEVDPMKVVYLGEARPSTSWLKEVAYKLSGQSWIKEGRLINFENFVLKNSTLEEIDGGKMLTYKITQPSKIEGINHILTAFSIGKDVSGEEYETYKVTFVIDQGAFTVMDVLSRYDTEFFNIEMDNKLRKHIKLNVWKFTKISKIPENLKYLWNMKEYFSGITYEFISSDKVNIDQVTISMFRY